MSREYAGIDVVAPPDVPADEKINGLAGVEIRGRRRRRRQTGGQSGRGNGKTRARSHRPSGSSQLRHFLVPWVLLSFPKDRHSRGRHSTRNGKARDAANTPPAIAQAGRRPDMPNATVAMARIAQPAM